MAIIHVAVAVIVNEQNQVLIALRQAHQHLGGLWEFPGGKVEENETTEVALAREIKEELGIEIHKAVPLIEIEHNYQDKSVLLDVWLTTDFVGEVQSMEGQRVQWCPIPLLSDYRFPTANKAIIETIQGTAF
jgi:8-oxo-dGTP diphosphatase